MIDSPPVHLNKNNFNVAVRVEHRFPPALKSFFKPDEMDRYFSISFESVELEISDKINNDTFSSANITSKK